MATKLSAMNASELGYGTSFRPAGIDGSTRAQINFKHELEKRVKYVTEDRRISLGRQQAVNAWVGDNKPAFSFVSLAPVMSCNKIYDTITASNFQVMKLTEVDSEIYRKLANYSGSDIQLPARANSNGIPQEVGFKGSKTGVNLCKEAFQEVLDIFSRIENKNLANFNQIQVPTGSKWSSAFLTEAWKF